MNLEQIASHLAKTWGTKTLEELRAEADREATGIAFDSIRVSDGRRLVIVICVTDVDQIARLERAIDLVDSGTIEDWNTLTLADVALRTFRGPCFSFESLRDEYGRRSALILIAAEPRSINMLEAIFALPK